tara:strand:- start:4342 stop:4881 length:540 start_codon:yes stop_codon:yes gene_type:complete
MACDITAGFSLGCRDNAGGIKTLYILSGSVTTLTEVSGEITDIDGTGIFYQFDLTRGTSDFTETINGSTENGTVFYESTVNAVFLKMQSSLRNQMKVLAQNPDLKLVVETNNAGTEGDKFFYVGEVYGAQLNGGQGQTGTAIGDANGYTLTFTAQEPNPAIPISGSVLADVLTGITISQ